MRNEREKLLFFEESTTTTTTTTNQTTPTTGKIRSSRRRQECIVFNEQKRERRGPFRTRNLRRRSEIEKSTLRPRSFKRGRIRRGGEISGGFQRRDASAQSRAPHRRVRGDIGQRKVGREESFIDAPIRSDVRDLHERRVGRVVDVTERRGSFVHARLFRL